MEVLYESKSGQSSCSDRKMESFIRQVCDQAITTATHPRTSILIKVLELHDNGGLPACAINATVLALIDAGIPMRYMVAAASCCIDSENMIHVNPDKDTMETSVGHVTLVVESKTQQILALDSRGSLSATRLSDSITSLTNKCVELFDYFRIYLSETLSPIS